MRCRLLMPGLSFDDKYLWTDNGTDNDFDRPSGTEASLHRYPGTSCLATISLSLRDKSHPPIDGKRYQVYPGRVIRSQGE